MQHLFFYLLGLIDAHLVRQIQFLKAQNEILRSRLGKEVHTRPEERRRLLKFGLPLGDALKDLISIVSYPTFRRWTRREGIPERRCRRGRPRKPEEIERLVVRLGRENAWGYSRILAELNKINIHSLCRNTVKNILKRNHLNPYAEAWVGTIRRECLDHFLVLGEGHLRYLVAQYVDFYNTVRPHGAMGGPLEPSAMPAEGKERFSANIDSAGCSSITTEGRRDRHAGARPAGRGRQVQGGASAHTLAHAALRRRGHGCGGLRVA